MNQTRQSYVSLRGFYSLTSSATIRIVALFINCTMFFKKSK